MFQQSTKLDPDFAMGYWGEAMTHNHPLWGDPQNTEAGRKAIGQAKSDAKLTARERAYVDAVKALYGSGEKPARDRAYREAMAKLHRSHPDDDEAALFYALALLGTAEPGPPGLQRRMQGAALALEVQRRKPKHPGAAHYIIHAFDDPEHAVLALPAAKLYAKIAAEEPHALHMPSHIFLQLGMWPEAAASNEAALTASQRPAHHGMQDLHSLHWLHYVYLQQDRYADAETLLDRMRKNLQQAGSDPFKQLYALSPTAAWPQPLSSRRNDGIRPRK